MSHRCDFCQTEHSSAGSVKIRELRAQLATCRAELEKAQVANNAKLKRMNELERAMSEFDPHDNLYEREMDKMRAALAEVTGQRDEARAELAVYKEHGREKDVRYRYAHHLTCDAVKKLKAAYNALEKRVAEGMEVWLTTSRRGFQKAFSEKPTIIDGDWDGPIGIPEDLWPNSGECRRALILLEKEEV